MKNEVFVVWHVHELSNGDENEKLIGIYASAEEAALAVERAKKRPGFSKTPDGFQICPYTLGKDEWTEGYVTIDNSNNEYD